MPPSLLPVEGPYRSTLLTMDYQSTSYAPNGNGFPPSTNSAHNSLPPTSSETGLAGGASGYMNGTAGGTNGAVSPSGDLMAFRILIRRPPIQAMVLPATTLHSPIPQLDQSLTTT